MHHFLLPAHAACWGIAYATQVPLTCSCNCSRGKPLHRDERAARARRRGHEDAPRRPVLEEALNLLAQAGRGQGDAPRRLPPLRRARQLERRARTGALDAEEGGEAHLHDALGRVALDRDLAHALLLGRLDVQAVCEAHLLHALHVVAPDVEGRRGYSFLDGWGGRRDLEVPCGTPATTSAGTG